MKNRIAEYHEKTGKIRLYLLDKQICMTRDEAIALFNEIDNALDDYRAANPCEGWEPQPSQR